MSSFEEMQAALETLRAKDLSEMTYDQMSQHSLRLAVLGVLCEVSKPKEPKRVVPRRSGPGLTDVGSLLEAPAEFGTSGNRLRRMAKRKGFRLCKSKRRDERAGDFGKYLICDDYSGSPVAGYGNYGFEFDVGEVEEFLAQN